MKKKRSRTKIKRALLIGVVFGLVVGILLTGIISSRMMKSQKKKLTAENEELQTKYDELSEEVASQVDVSQPEETLSDSSSWMLAYIGVGYTLSSTYEPELSNIDEEQTVDARIADSLTSMLEAASEAGLSLYVDEAYVSYEDLSTEFSSAMEKVLDNGDEAFEAYTTAAESMAVPGQSEHNAGLGVDILSSDYASDSETADEDEAATEEQQWLEANCASYGFILRYPTDKAEITGVSYDPWHYRYVGEDAAKEIMEQGITLEEYLGLD